MELNGDCLLAFKKWYTKKYFTEHHDGSQSINIINKGSVSFNRFLHLDDNMKYGVYEDFFDSVGIYITDAYLDDLFKNRYWFDVSDEKGNVIWNKECVSRQEARTEAIEKANQIFNER